MLAEIHIESLVGSLTGPSFTPDEMIDYYLALLNASSLLTLGDTGFAFKHPKFVQSLAMCIEKASEYTLKIIQTDVQTFEPGSTDLYSFGCHLPQNEFETRREYMQLDHNTLTNIREKFDLILGRAILCFCNGTDINCGGIVASRLNDFFCHTADRLNEQNQRSLAILTGARIFNAQSQNATLVYRQYKHQLEQLSEKFFHKNLAMKFVNNWVNIIGQEKPDMIAPGFAVIIHNPAHIKLYSAVDKAEPPDYKQYQTERLALIRRKKTSAKVKADKSLILKIIEILSSYSGNENKIRICNATITSLFNLIYLLESKWKNQTVYINNIRQRVRSILTELEVSNNSYYNRNVKSYLSHRTFQMFKGDGELSKLINQALQALYG